MMILGQAFFWLTATFAVLGALATVTAKNPIRGAMGLLAMIVAIAGLFIALHAQFLAAIQLIVYAGAIVVLFLFVIMLLGPSASTASDHRGRVARTIGGAVFGLAGAAAILLLVLTAQRGSGPAPLLPGVSNDFGSVDAFGRILFTHGLLPFELSSALLMVAIVGAVAVARGRSKSEALAMGKSPGQALAAGRYLAENLETPLEGGLEVGVNRADKGARP
jgi:NADH-quinone oxidoreductase subunit J